MNPEAARAIWEAYRTKLTSSGRDPTDGELRDMERYLAFAEGRDPDELQYDPEQQADAEDDV